MYPNLGYGKGLQIWDGFGFYHCFFELKKNDNERTFFSISHFFLTVVV